MLARLCSESFKLGFSSLWTKNFQMFKLDLEKAEEPGIKLPTFTEPGRKQRNSRKTSTSASVTMLKPLTEMGVPDHLTCLLRNQVKKEAIVRTGHGMTDWFQMEKEVWQGYIWSPCSFNFDVEATVHGPTELDMTEWLSTAQSESESCSAVSNSLLPHGVHSPWNSSCQNTGVGSLSLLQGIFPTQGSNPGLLHYSWILYQLSHKGSPGILEGVAYPFSSRSSHPRNWTGMSCIVGGFFTN